MPSKSVIRLGIVAVAFAVVASACGDSDDDSAADTTAAPTTAAPTTAAPTTAAPTTAAPTTAAPTTAAPADGAVAVGLVEWAVETEATYAAGPVSFAVSNNGEFPHEFGIVRGTSYEDLPQLANGAIDEDTLGDAVLGKTDQLDPGASTTIDFDLEPGDYVFFCNINFGPNSHAAQGQVLSVTVTG